LSESRITRITGLHGKKRTHYAIPSPIEGNAVDLSATLSIINSSHPLTLSHQGRGDLTAPSPLEGEGWGQCC